MRRAPSPARARRRIRLHAHLQRVALWLDDTPDAQELRAARSQRGFRSLQLACAGARWQPVVRGDGAQAAAGTGALSGNTLGLNMHSGVALEESFVGGMRRETIRSTVQVTNELDFPVQVRRPPPSFSLQGRGQGLVTLRGSQDPDLCVMLRSSS
jgi:hypothetical protein